MRGARSTVAPTVLTPPPLPPAFVPPLPSSQAATPPWWEHVPEWVLEKLYVPSLHRAVAPRGAVDVGAATAVVADMVAAAVVVGDIVTTPVVVAGVVATDVSQTATPPWWEQVPERVCE
jgi:hypothetical protein